MDAGLYDTYARLESVASKNYEGTARTIQHPGWSQTAQVQHNTNIVLMLPSAHQASTPVLCSADVIDVDVIEADPETTIIGADKLIDGSSTQSE